MISITVTSRSACRLALIGAAAVLAASAMVAPAQAKCIKTVGWGTGALQGFASFMAEAAAKNSAKSNLGESVKIGAMSTKCAWKGLLYECTASARACK